MLTREENDLLTRIGPGTAMGNVMREYWMPVLLSEELQGNDSGPLRVRLLGEDLLAFRDSNGRVGLVGDKCLHRNASLYYARNEECGLRCVYHGWKYDISGQCVDTPNEPPESRMKEKVRIKSYLCVERNGIIWSYMGTKSPAPELPALEWTLVPSDQAYISKRVQACNWAQVLEGGIDSSHGSFLHTVTDTSKYSAGQRRGWNYNLTDRHPRFEVATTDYGVLIGVRRNAEEKDYYWRITQFLMPFYTMIPPYGPNPSINGHAFVPMDDETTLVWTVTWHPNRAIKPEERSPRGAYEALGGGVHLPHERLLPPNSAPAGAWMPMANKDNDYLLDRELQRSTRFSGVPGIATQDAAVQESMGPISDRTTENLGMADAGIARVRRFYIQAAQDLQEKGLTPTGVKSPDAYSVRSAAVVLPKDAPWVEAAKDWLEIRPGIHLDAA